MAENIQSKKEYQYCLRCNRKLKNPEARKIGYGAVCYKKIQNIKRIPLF